MPLLVSTIAKTAASLTIELLTV